MANSTTAALFRKYLDDTITAEELTQLYRLVNEQYDPAALEEALGQAFHAPPPGFFAETGATGEIDREEVFAFLRARIAERRQTVSTPVIPLYRRRWFGYAAVVLLLVVAGLMVWVDQRSKKGMPPVIANTRPSPKNDISPGHEGAILTLAGGRRIVLDSARNGFLDTQGSSTITLGERGRLDYTSVGHAGDRPDQLLYNTLTTPRARKMTVTLADGTQVWLNAASSLRFPAAFTGKERRVEVSGEAYFEIAKDANKPFVVARAGTDESIIVLGTRFNVNAYDDEDAMKTTLVQGSVKVARGGKTVLLTPGQQAVLDHDGHDILIVDDANIDEVVAWMKGRFTFNHMDLKSVMRQLERWYDVDVTYETDKLPGVSIGGFIHDDVYLSTIMEFLGKNGVHYRIDGKKITILP